MINFDIHTHPSSKLEAITIPSKSQTTVFCFSKTSFSSNSCDTGSCIGKLMDGFSQKVLKGWMFLVIKK